MSPLLRVKAGNTWLRPSISVALVATAASVLMPAAYGANTTIKVWSVWPNYQKAIQDIGDLYEKSHPGVIVKVETTDMDYTRPQKFFTSVIAGSPPDVVTVDGTQIPQWVEANMLLPLDQYMQQARLKSSDYFIPAWRQQEYKGHQWAMSMQANPCFTLFWNRDVFSQVGLDPDQFPKTLDEMDTANAKLIKFSANGKLIRTGLLPWTFYGGANSAFNWGWIFGGSFYDEANKKATANDPKIVKALQWMYDMATTKYEYAKNAAICGWVDPANLIKGTQAIMAAVPNFELENLQKLSSKFVPGMTNQQPYPEGGVPHVSWDGGWAYGIPRNAKHKSEAWDFIRWMTSSPDGTKALYAKTGFLSAWAPSPVFADFAKDPKMKMLITDTLSQARFYRPVTPATPVYMAELDTAVPLIMQGKKSPQDVLDQVTQKVQKELLKYANRKR